MLVVMKSGAPQEEVEKINRILTQMQVSVTQIGGDQQSVFALVGDKGQLDVASIRSNKYVDKVVRVFTETWI